MSKEIYINTGTSFQQQYIARQPAIGTAPVTAQYDAQGNANSQSPFTYSHRNPFTYRNPVNSQTPYIANKQNPYPYIANSQTPYIANRQQPYPYPASAQQTYPYIANAQQPYPYIASARQPGTYQARQPGTYARQGRTPFTYQHRTPSTYQSRSPFTYNARQPANATGQTPYIYTWSSTGTVVETQAGKTDLTYQLPLSPNNFEQQITLGTNRGGGELKITWGGGSVNTNWTTCRIGSTAQTYSTLTRTSDFNISNQTHYTAPTMGGAYTSPQYIPNLQGASGYFALLG